MMTIGIERLRLVNEQPDVSVPELANDFGLQAARQQKIERRQRQLACFALLRLDDETPPLVTPHINAQPGGTTMTPYTYTNGQPAGYMERSWYGTPWVPFGTINQPGRLLQLRQYHYLFQDRRDNSIDRPSLAIWTRPGGFVSSGQPTYSFTSIPKPGESGGDILRNDQPLPLSSAHWDELDAMLDSLADTFYLSADDPRWLRDACN